MKENDNIQTPVKVDIRDILKIYGSHYTIETVQLDEDGLIDIVPYTFIIKEQVGPKDRHNEWHHQFATLEDAHRAACNRMEIEYTKFLHFCNDIENSSSHKFKKFLANYGIGSYEGKAFLKKNAARIALFKHKIETFKNKSATFKVNYLSGVYTMPQYMPKMDETYYLLNLNDLSNIKLTPMKLNPDDVMIFDYRGSTSNDKFADQFDFKFSHYFIGPNDKAASLDAERLLRFNGQYWGVGVLNYYLFVDKKDALAFAKSCAETTVAKMQRELISINESIAKL